MERITADDEEDNDGRFRSLILPILALLS